MSRKTFRRKCRCCKKFFAPDYRNRDRQFFCRALECRRASKAHSQRRWLNKPGNRDLFRCKENVQRVQQWREAHPGYWRKIKQTSKGGQLIDSQRVNPKQGSCNVPEPQSRTLQDFCLTQDPAFLGLISLVTGSTLQDDIDAIARNVLRRGMNILGLQVLEDPQNSMPSKHDQ